MHFKLCFNNSSYLKFRWKRNFQILRHFEFVASFQGIVVLWTHHSKPESKQLDVTPCSSLTLCPPLLSSSTSCFCKHAGFQKEILFFFKHKAIRIHQEAKMWSYDILLEIIFDIFVFVLVFGALNWMGFSCKVLQWFTTIWRVQALRLVLRLLQLLLHRENFWRQRLLVFMMLFLRLVYICKEETSWDSKPL